MNPYPSLHCGSSTTYEETTRVNVLMTSIDPDALDYWAAKYFFLQTAELIGYEDMQALDPDYITRETLIEALGVWLRLTEIELIQKGYTGIPDES